MDATLAVLTTVKNTNGGGVGGNRIHNVSSMPGSGKMLKQTRGHTTERAGRTQGHYKHGKVLMPPSWLAGVLEGSVSFTPGQMIANFTISTDIRPKERTQNTVR